MSRANADFRSDTITPPLPEMIAAISEASWGDSVYGEDECIVHLEERVAKLAGKEKGLFCPSGTLSNQIGLRCNLFQPPHSVLCDYRAHVYTAEAGGLATLSQAMVTPVYPANGVYLTLEDVKKKVIFGEDIHTAPTKVISLENTLSGTIMPIEDIRKISKWARKHGIRMHLDGARLWNASAATGVSIAEYCKYFDSVSLCMSKGLCAPVGSVLVGDAGLIKRAEWLRKQQGGGIRQAGWLACAAMIALDKVWPTMPETHKRVRELAERLEAAGVYSALPVQTNFIFLDPAKSKINMDIFREQANNNGLKVWGERLAFHYWTSDEAIKALEKTLTDTVALSKSCPVQHSHHTSAYGRVLEDDDESSEEEEEPIREVAPDIQLRNAQVLRGGKLSGGLSPGGFNGPSILNGLTA